MDNSGPPWNGGMKLESAVFAVNLTVGKHSPHLQVAGGQSDDGGLIQLWGDSRGQRQELGKLIKLPVFFLSSGFRCILGLLLHFWHVATPLRIIKAHLKLQLRFLSSGETVLHQWAPLPTCGVLFSDSSQTQELTDDLSDCLLSLLLLLLLL